MMDTARTELEAGTELAGYRVEAVLGRGGMGVVYRAFDLALERKVALKLLVPELAADSEFRERFHRESRLAASLDHRSVVPIYQAGEVDGQLYIAMRLVEGTDMKQLLRKERRLEPATAVAIVAQIAEALDAAHERGLVHRDVKPSNVLVDSRGHAYLADFGLSRHVADYAQAGLAESRSLGTSDYIAPEQIRGEQTLPQTDVYSLGCLLYECLAGDPPFRRSSELATVFAHLEERPPLLPRLERVLSTALAKDPEERYPSCGLFVEDASAALGLHRRRRRRLLVGTSIAAVAAIAATLAASLFALLSEDAGAIARSEALAEQAVGAADADPQTALRLAVEAASVAHTAKSEGALRVTLASDHLRATFRGHTGYVSGVAFSPDGKRLITASDDGTARIWDAASGRTLHVLQGHRGPVDTLAASPDGKRILTVGGRDRTIRIWDAVSGRILHVLRSPNGYVYGAGFSADGKRILSLSAVGARVWDVNNGQSLRLIRGNFGSAVFSPDGKRVLTSSYDAARIWDAATGRGLQLLRAESGGIGSAVFSPDGKRVVSYGGTARIWDVATGSSLHVLGDSELVWSAVFSADSKLVLTAESPASSPRAGGTARVWDVATGRSLHALPTRVTSAVFSPDGKEVLTASPDGTFQIWDAVGGDNLQAFRARTDGVATPGRDGLGNGAVFSPDGTQVATVGGHGRIARIWNAASSRSLRVLRGKRVVTVGDDGRARIRDVDSGRTLRVLDGDTESVSSASFSRDGKRVVATDTTTARIWDAVSGRALRVLRGHADFVRSAVFSLDGERVVTAGDDKTARVWDVDSGRALRVLRGHTHIVYSAVFSSDGNRILTASADRTARIWDLNSGRSVHVLVGHTRSVGSAVFSADGRQVLTTGGDGTARIWDTASGRVLQLLHVGPVLSAVFSPDGKEIVTVGSDGSVRIWDAATAAKLQVLRADSDLDSAGFSPDGKHVVAASGVRPARIWACGVCGVPSEELLVRAKERLRHSARFFG